MPRLGTRCTRCKKDGTACRSLSLKGKDHCRFHSNAPVLGSTSIVLPKCEYPACQLQNNQQENVIQLECGHRVHDGCLILFVKERSAGKMRCPVCLKLLQNQKSVIAFFKEMLTAYSEKLISLQDLLKVLKEYKLESAE